MKFSNEEAVSLGFVEKDGGVTKDGKSYDGYAFLSYVVNNEISSRRYYIKDNTSKELISKFKELGEDWLTPFYFSGEIDNKGNIIIQNIHKQE